MKLKALVLASAALLSASCVAQQKAVDRPIDISDENGGVDFEKARKVAKLLEEKKKNGDYGISREQECYEAEPKIQYVERKPTPQDLVEYAQKNGYEIYRAEDIEQLKSYVVEMAQLAKESGFGTENPHKKRAERLEALLNNTRKEYETQIRSLKSDIEAYTRQVIEKQKTIRYLNQEIDELEDRPPIVRMKPAQELYVQKDVLDDGILNITLREQTLVFPRARYLCEIETRGALSCMDLSEIIKQAANHQ